METNIIKNYKPKFSASIVCMNQTEIGSTIRDIENFEKNYNKTIIDSWHVDLMDGMFVPRIGLAPEIIRDIRKISDKPIEVHCMLSNVDEYLDLFAKYGASIISFHYEGNNSILKTIGKIKELKMSPWVVYNVHTLINPMLQPYVDGVEFMSINPGVLGSPVYLDAIYTKLSIGTKFANRQEPIYAIDGGVRWNSIDHLLEKKIEYMVAGSGVLFNADGLYNNLNKLLKIKEKYNG